MEVQVSEPHESLIDVHGLAHLLGISAHTIRGLRCRNPDALPPAIKIGGSIRWRPRDVDDFLDRRAEAG